MLKPGQTRFFLATMVVFYHLNESIFLGKFAVGCFFILSGYWISLMYENKYSKLKNPLKIFYISRFWRLLPVFYTFTILGVITSLIASNDLASSYSALAIGQKVGFFISNIIIFGYASSKINILGPAWSLDIELQFYLLFPLILYFFKGKNQRLIIIVVLLFLLKGFIVVTHQADLLKTALNYLYLFFVGVIVYHFKLKASPRVEKAGLLILFLIFIINLAVPSLLARARDGDSQYYQVLSIVMIIPAIPTLINSVHNQTDQFDNFLGEMSYMVYLSHWVWIIPYQALVLHASRMGEITYALGFLVITFLSSYLVYKFIDRPSEKLRHNWIKKQLPDKEFAPVVKTSTRANI